MWIHIRNLVRFILTVAVIYAVLIVLGSYCFIVNAAFLVLAFILADIFIKFIWRSLPSSTLSDLKDRAVLITGCDRGFGNELARQLDGKGVTVFAGCLFAEGTGAQELKKNCSKKLHVVQLDVTKEDQVKAAVETIKDTLKGKLLFSIVNNAGILTLAETEYLCTEEQKKVLEVNTFGVSNVTQAFLPMLRESKGRVVIVASSASTTALPFMVAYNMSKFAVFAYAETLRREMMRWGISVHTIEPWIYGTDIVNLEQNVLKLKTEFNRAPKDIQKKYGGEEYIKSFENIYGFGLAISQPRGKIHEVTNCLADAAIGKHPELRYTPGLKGKFLTWLTTVFPLEAIDLFFYHLINFYMRTEMPLLARRRAHKRKQEWVNEILARRDRYGEFSHLQGDLEMNVTQHFCYFRMKKETFQYILDEVKDHLQKYNNFRETISPAERLAVTFRYLATGLSFKALSMSYRISDVTVGRIIHETCVVIWETLHNVHMPFPSEDEVDHIESEFWKKWKFPNCVRCIDGKHIRIKCPKQSGSMFYNYKHFFSIVLQAVVSADYKFVCIDIGAYGKQSDSGIFGFSKLSEQLERGALKAKCEKVLPDSDISVPYVLVGDGGYPLKPYLMRPYPLRNLTREQETFNKRLSHARQVVECAFGIISNKWRILMKAIEVTPERAENIVKCICLLHNIILDKEGMSEISGNSTESGNCHNRFVRGANRSSTRATDVREKFKAYFANNP